MFYAQHTFPIVGQLSIVTGDRGIEKIFLFKEDFECYKQQGRDELIQNEAACKEVIMQLEEYFKGTRKQFDLKYHFETTPFRTKVWQALEKIPYGETRSYKEIAQAVLQPNAVRAVGGANHANPLPIIIPCHRVIGSKGQLVGYAGSHTKLQQQLLALEASYK